MTETGEFFYMVLFQLYWHWYQRQVVGLSENNNLVPNNLGSHSNGKEGINPLKNLNQNWTLFK